MTRCWQVTSENEYACLCTFLETLLTMVWCAPPVPGFRPAHVADRQVPLLRGHAEQKSKGACPAIGAYSSAHASLLGALRI